MAVSALVSTDHHRSLQVLCILILLVKLVKRVFAFRIVSRSDNHSCSGRLHLFFRVSTTCDVNSEMLLASYDLINAFVVYLQFAAARDQSFLNRCF